MPFILTSNDEQIDLYPELKKYLELSPASLEFSELEGQVITRRYTFSSGSDTREFGLFELCACLGKREHLEALEKSHEDYVFALTQSKIEDIRSRKLALEESESATLISLDVEESNLCFYLIRHLIRRGVARGDQPAEDHVNTIAMLLSIPGVHELRFKSVHGGPEHELFTLARQIENKEVHTLLMQLPAIKNVNPSNASSSASSPRLVRSHLAFHKPHGQTSDVPSPRKEEKAPSSDDEGDIPCISARQRGGWNL